MQKRLIENHGYLWLCGNGDGFGSGRASLLGRRGNGQGLGWGQSDGDGSGCGYDVTPAPFETVDPISLLATLGKQVC